MSIPWLLSTGFTLSFAALFSKLWRINRLFNATPGIRRIVVRQQDVLAPFVVLFTLNLGLLLGWTIADPLRWERFEVEGQAWNTYGRCGGGTVSVVMLSLLAAVNVGALLMACSQAYLARNISDEFSESKYIGIAIYGWFQILVVGVPILFLIGSDNPVARYFLQVLLIFIVSMSMLLILFVPAFVNYNKQRRSPRQRVTVTGIQASSFDFATQVQGSDDLQTPEHKPHSSMSTASRTGNVPMAVMDSIAESSESALEEAHANRLSGSVENRVLESGARSRKRMIENEIELKDCSMEENVNKMMLAMEEDSSEDSS
jgi:uncharacterized protein YhhL (DUF1145 family)